VDADTLYNSQGPMSKQVTCRAAREADLDGVAKLHLHVTRTLGERAPRGYGAGLRSAADLAQTRAEFAEALTEADALLLVAELDGQLAGYALAVVETAGDDLLDSPFGTLQYLVVKEAFRGRGIGKALIERACDAMRDRGITVMDLLVWEFNEEARRLYERCGFSTLERRLVRRLDR